MAKRKPVAKKPADDKRIGWAMWLAVILAAHLALGLVYWHNTRWDGAPDEGAHGRYVEHLLERGLPVYDSGDETAYEFYQPPLYYALGVPFQALGRAVGMEHPGMAVRALSIILGGLSVLVVFLAVRRAFRDDLLALVCAAFVALLPTHVMTGSSVSNDILGELVFGLFFLVSAGILADGLSARRTVGMGAVLGVGLLAKATCLFLFPLALAVLLLARRCHNMPFNKAAGHAAGALLVSLVIGGWWLARNALVYGDPLSMGQLMESFAAHSPNPEDWFAGGMSPLTYLTMVVLWTFRSFWGAFGYMTDPSDFLPGWTYWLLFLSSVAALVGLRRGIRALDKESSGILVVYWLALGLVLASFLKLNATVFQAQGRYLFPALIPIAVVWAAGMRGLLPPRVATSLAVGIPLLAQLVALSACVLG